MSHVDYKMWIIKNVACLCRLFWIEMMFTIIKNNGSIQRKFKLTCYSILG